MKDKIYYCSDKGLINLVVINFTKNGLIFLIVYTHKR